MKAQTAFALTEYAAFVTLWILPPLSHPVLFRNCVFIFHLCCKTPAGFEAISHWAKRSLTKHQLKSDVYRRICLWRTDWAQRLKGGSTLWIIMCNGVWIMMRLFASWNLTSGVADFKFKYNCFVWKVCLPPSLQIYTKPPFFPGTSRQVMCTVFMLVSLWRSSCKSSTVYLKRRLSCANICWALPDRKVKKQNLWADFARLTIKSID